MEFFCLIHTKHSWFLLESRYMRQFHVMLSISCFVSVVSQIQQLYSHCPLYKREVFLLLPLLLFQDPRPLTISTTLSHRRTHTPSIHSHHPLPASRTQHAYTPRILKSTTFFADSIQSPPSRCQTNHNLHPAPKHPVRAATAPPRVRLLNAKAM